MARGSDLKQGEAITLFPAAAYTVVTAGTNGTAVFVGGERKRFIFILRVTAAATDAADTLNMFVDFSIDGVTYFNGGHFTPVLGNGGAVSYYMVFDASAPGTAVIATTADAANSTVRPSLFGAYVRGRYILVDADVNASFTLSVTGYAI